ncbi:MAG: type II toxin-antitoxin system RelE/ParE family toxin [Bacteroidota bacterium]|nr:type II toxin-antitoxin system RelE/ParE family toxin [Bacteroidota bacterium]
MGLKIYWTDFSKSELHQIFDYYKETASLRIARKLVLEITKAVLKLKEQPNIGQKEKLLLNRKEEFRYLVCKNYKVLYWLNESENRIEITDIFDTRQNPSKIDRSQ